MSNFVYDDQGNPTSKRCKICKDLKPLSEFTKQVGGKFGLGSYCKPCDTERGKKYYRSNKGSHALSTKRWHEENRELLTVRAQKQRTKLDALKNSPCVDCGGEFPPYVMDYHHRDPLTKSFNLGTSTRRTWEKVLAEIEKCDLLCSNCHRIRHHAVRLATKAAA